MLNWLPDRMEIFLNGFGLLSSSIFLIVLFAIMRLAPRYRLSEMALSTLGTLPKIGKVFNLTLIIYAVVLFLFLLRLLDFFGLFRNVILMAVLFLTAGCGLFSGIVSASKSKQLHHALGGTCFFLGCVSGLLFAGAIFSRYSILAYTEIFLTVIVSLLLLRGFKKWSFRTLPGNYELVFFWGLHGWVFLNTIPLFLS